MRRLNRTISTLLLLGAFGLVLAIGFSDHSDDYGRVTLPSGGTIHLPEGTVTVYDRVSGDSSAIEDDTAQVSFQVVPAGGGEPVSLRPVNSEASDTQVTKTETIGEFGALAKLDVPGAGDYQVRGGSDLEPGSVYLDFGTNAGQALLDRWKLIVGLLVGSLVFALIPPPRRRRRWEEPTWSSDPREPYAPPDRPAAERAAH